MPTRPLPKGRRTLDPQLPKGRKKLMPTLVVSAIAIAVILFDRGDLPQVNNAFALINDIIQSHNDEIVQSITHYAPFALIGVALLAAIFLLATSRRNRRKPA